MEQQPFQVIILSISDMKIQVAEQLVQGHI